VRAWGRQSRGKGAKAGKIDAEGSIKRRGKGTKRLEGAGPEKRD